MYRRIGFQNCAVRMGLRQMMTPNESGWPWFCYQVSVPRARSSKVTVETAPTHFLIGPTSNRFVDIDAHLSDSKG